MKIWLESRFILNVRIEKISRKQNYSALFLNKDKIVKRLLCCKIRKLKVEIYL